MKIINLGILAHVDAGKTTLTESLLYTSGAIAEPGSVDKGTTRTDTMNLERQRGITIQTAVTSFQWEDVKVNIIDTPGHMDFLAEVYRSLSVLDGAVLLVSAKDGIQAQTRILFHALQTMKIPTIFFINKIDQEGIDLPMVYLCTFNEVADTNVEAVFDLILDAAVRNNVPQEELPETLYLISDMEFNACVRNASVSNFASAKRRFAEHGYRLPQIVFWNVASRNSNQPVTKNEQGVALVSGCTPRLFSMVASGDLSPYSVMMDIIESERYAKISA